MNRIIKFRGVCLLENRWVYGHLSKKEGCYHIANTHHVRERSIGQSTGIFDKNNVEIYEGDILKVYVKPENGKEWEHISVCTWHTGIEDGEYDYIKSGFEIWIGGEYEVIGNTFDTPNLIPIRTI